MVGPFELPGYDVLAPLDATGRSWRAVCLEDGRRVVLRRWTGGAARVAEVRRRAALWGSVAGDGVVAVRDVVVLGDDLVVVSDLARGGGLDTVVGRRGGLTPGQVVTAVAPVARTLAAAHARGLVHGRIALSNVVLDEDGRPMLTDWLLAGNGEAAADVAALVAMALGCLLDDAPADLSAALRSASDAHSLADALLSTVSAEPLLAASTTPSVERPPDDQPVAARHGLMGAAAVAAAAIALVLGVGSLWGSGDSSAAGTTLPPRVTTSVMPTPTPTSTVSDWTSIVLALERRRMHALDRADRRILATCEQRGTRLWRHDVRLLTHARLHHIPVRVRSVRVQSVRVGLAVLRVADAFSSYRVVTLRLRRIDGAWLIAGVSRRSP